LVVLSFVCVSKFNPTQPSNLEYVLLAWVICLIIDEFSQYFKNQKHHLKLPNNRFDLIIYVIFAVIIVLRLIGVFSTNPRIAYSSHMILLFNTIFCYLRLLGVFSASLILGPLFFSIVTMLIDILKFAIFFLIFILSFSWALMGYVHEYVPDETWNSLYPDGPILLPLWATFGEFSSSFPFVNSMDTVGIILLGVYLFAADILLVNLLIAMMNDSYSRIHDNADLEWQFARYSLVSEYEAASALPPPLNIIQLLFRLLRLQVPAFTAEEVIEEDKRERFYLLETSNGYIISNFTKQTESPEAKAQTILDQMNSNRNAYLKKKKEKEDVNPVTLDDVTSAISNMSIAPSIISNTTDKKIE